MHKASAVMYSIANFFTWILVFLSIGGIVLSILGLLKVNPDIAANFGGGTLAYCIIVFIVSLITIALVRRAKAKGTSKGWDVLFLVFYILGGIFGLCERR